MKSKFQNLNFGSVAVLSKEQQKKVNGGAYGAGSGQALACIATVYCSTWDYSHTQIKYASGATCVQAFSAMNCGSWSTSP